jgi:hypothetical protein
MKTRSARFLFSVKKITPQHIQVALTLLALALFALGAGAPADAGVLPR